MWTRRSTNGSKGGINRLLSYLAMIIQKGNEKLSERSGMNTLEKQVFRLNVANTTGVLIITMTGDSLCVFTLMAYACTLEWLGERLSRVLSYFFISLLLIEEGCDDAKGMNLFLCSLTMLVSLPLDAMSVVCCLLFCFLLVYVSLSIRGKRKVNISVISFVTMYVFLLVVPSSCSLLKGVAVSLLASIEFLSVCLLDREITIHTTRTCVVCMLYAINMF